MSFVYAGKYLRIDLTTGTCSARPIRDQDVREYLLGSGLAAKLFDEEMDPALDPLDPRSPILIFNGLLSGTFAPTGCRSSFCGRSPLTGIWNEANVGGHWGAELRFAGYDGLVITGRAASPVYLYITNQGIELHDAAHLWGLDHFRAFDELTAETDSKARVACIGPAGENLVEIAGVMTGGHGHSRAAARGGMGALLGGKNLKAIVVRGQNRPEYANPTGLRDTVRAQNALIKEIAAGLSLAGTAGGTAIIEDKGGLPIRNWQLGSWPEGAAAISGKRIHETIWVKHTFCHACPIGCGKAVEIKDGPYAGTWGEGPEYETVAGFGSLMVNDDLNSIVQANDLCNRLGLDTISTSSVIAFAVEAFEKGLITTDQTGGLELRWSDPATIHALIDKIAYRRDIGDVLAKGVRAAAQRLGPAAARFAVHVKGMEIPYHDPRAYIALAVNYATANRGACHLEAPTYWRAFGVEWEGWGQVGPHNYLASDGAAELAVAFQDYMATYNPLGLCKFIARSKIGPDHIAQLVNDALSWDWTMEDVLRTGERLFNLKRLINARYGVARKDDTLPERMLREPRPTGKAAGNLPDWPRLLDDYYAARGWDSNGLPTHERLAALELSRVG